jgi:tetratricopeptide (TPR) repeat protein
VISYFECPRCASSLVKTLDSSFCECGWYDRASEKAARKSVDSKTMKGLIAFSILLAAVYVHLVNWGGDAVSIISLRARQATSTLSPRGYDQLAQVCINVNNWSCAENAYTQNFLITKDPAALSKHASLLVALQRKDEALAIFAKYFNEGGKDGGTMVEYAKLLEMKNKEVEAVKFYLGSIKARPEILSVQAESGIVRILIKQGKYKQALTRVEAFHDSAGNAKGYLNTELAQLKGRLQTVARQ